MNKKHVPPPKPSLNGGLYTGVPFAPGAPWGNVQVTPDAGYMTHYNLRTANPPPGAIYQYPGANRPGNSFTEMTGVERYNDSRFNIFCINDKEKSLVSTLEDTKNNNTRFSKYYYVN